MHTKSLKAYFPLLFLICCLYLPVSAQPVKVIFDTDMESDVDDVGALAMLHSLADLGEAEILAVMLSSLNPWSAPTVDVVNTWFGRPDIPIGNVKTKGVYRNSGYARPLTAQFPHDLELGENAENAVGLYRKILASQPDQSVVIITVGYLTNLSKLIQSTPDQHSELDGTELVAKKVKLYVCMGGRYPAQLEPGKWGNLMPDPEATQYVANHWPGDILFTGGGDFSWTIPTGQQLMNQGNEEDPVFEAYKTFYENSGWSKGPTHHSADLIAVYVGVRGYEPHFVKKSQGYNHIFEDGTMVWRQSPNRTNHAYVSEWDENAEPQVVIQIFDDLMIKQKR